MKFGSKVKRECWWCGKSLKDGETMCKECLEYFKKNGVVSRDDEENGQLAHTCAMCGKECPFVDRNGHCSTCRQVWNS